MPQAKQAKKENELIIIYNYSALISGRSTKNRGGSREDIGINNAGNSPGASALKKE